MYHTITSKINVTPKGVYLLISKLHSNLAVANLPELDFQKTWTLLKKKFTF